MFRNKPGGVEVTGAIWKSYILSPGNASARAFF